MLAVEWFNYLPAIAVVQETYICASAVIVEANLSLLGAGTPPEIASWGNIMAEGRAYIQIAFWVILFPWLFLAAVDAALHRWLRITASQ
jgi:peptide/nickel transport system permease protein